MDVGQGDAQEFLHLFLAHQLEIQSQPRQHAEFGECAGVAQPAVELRRGLVGQPCQQTGEPDQPRVQGGENFSLWVGGAVGQPRLPVLDHRVQAVGGQGHGRQLGGPQRDSPAQPQLTGDGGVEVVEQVRHPRRGDAGRQSTVGHHTADLLAAFEDADALALAREGGCSGQAIVAGADDDGVKGLDLLLLRYRLRF